MKVRLTKQNVSEIELAKALAGIATEEGVTHEVHELLSKMIKSDNHDHGEIIPERYIRYICDKLDSDFKTLLMLLTDNVERYLLSLEKSNKSVLKSFLSKADDSVPILTQEQIDELKNLIEAHFRAAIGVSYHIDSSWQKAGIKFEHVDLSQWIKNAYVAGRLADVLNNNTTFADMMKKAKELPLSRMDQLILQMAQNNAAKYIVGYGQKMGQLATDVSLDAHKLAINAVVQSYFAGDLKTVGEENGVIRKVISWRQLASELRDRFKQTDIVRDWQRVAFTETRFATNLGRLMNAQIEGGGNAEDIEIYFHVQSTACSSCRRLYLNSDGTPKIFKLSEILMNVAETGGMNVNRKASRIGSSDGWLPNASTHPLCHCYPVRVKKDYPNINMGDELND